MEPVKNFDVKTFVRKNISEMKPYSSARDEFKGEAEVFLDANENPFPTGYNRYPDPLQWKVKGKLAAIKNVKPEQIFLGNGSDEAIDLIIRAFCEPNRDSILVAEPTYGMYAVCAEVNAVNIQKTLLTSDFDIDLNTLKQEIDETTKVIFLCSPNNPTAALLDRKTILSILNEFRGIVVVDEAYIDFSNSTSFIQELSTFPNLIVLQTFSKAWGLAGLRLGMAYASEELINILNKIKYPYNINVQTQQIALDALENEAAKVNWVKEILSERDKLNKSLQALTMVEEVFPSDANFILVRMKNASTIYKNLMEQKIIVRDRTKVQLCKDCLRITVGTPQENDKLMQSLKSLDN